MSKRLRADSREFLRKTYREILLSTISSDWKRAASVDPTLRFRGVRRGDLNRKRLYPSKYSPDAMFKNMLRGKIAVYRDYPVHNKIRTVDELADLLSEEGTNGRQRVWIGSDGRLHHRSIRRIVSDWHADNVVLGLTDYHFRNTRLEDKLDVRAVSGFNLLPAGKRGCEREEMMTLVLASSGYFTDSHSDDPDGTNHCITGKKLWLAWDTEEGLSAGLEDVERCDIAGEHAEFSLTTFLKLNSSKWFYVKNGETLFLPGNFTHKVYTLEKYLGYGSFYVSLPNYLRTMSRWVLRGPMWANGHQSKDDSLKEIARIAISQLDGLSKEGWSRRKSVVGYGSVDESISSWKKEFSGFCHILVQDWKISGFLNAWRKLSPARSL